MRTIFRKTECMSDDNNATSSWLGKLDCQAVNWISHLRELEYRFHNQDDKLLGLQKWRVPHKQLIHLKLSKQFLTACN
jgi:hypothetical protein